MWRRALLAFAALAAAAAVGLTSWIAWPTISDLPLPAPLEPWLQTAPPARYSEDLASLVKAFQPQRHRSFCGPASIETVLRAYGRAGLSQSNLFPSFSEKLETFFSGMSLAELASLAQSVGLRTEVVYADALDLPAFRERLKANLEHPGDFVVVNYDRQVLKQAGAGHISPVAAYDPARDAFLVLDEAAYRYPFTWVPAPLLFEAVHTRAGERYRGVVFISNSRGVNP